MAKLRNKGYHRSGTVVTDAQKARRNLEMFSRIDKAEVFEECVTFFQGECKLMLATVIILLYSERMIK
jgi:hypothetical protein